MPPLPSTPDDLHSSIARRLDDIETYQIPRLAKCTGPIGLQRELADETKGDLEQVRRNIEVRPFTLSVTAMQMCGTDMRDVAVQRAGRGLEVEAEARERDCLSSVPREVQVVSICLTRTIIPL